MYYVYVLRSEKNKDVYVGFSTNLKNRYKAHCQGKVKSTKAYRPWILVYYEAYSLEEQARKREKELKLHVAKEALLKRLNISKKA